MQLVYTYQDTRKDGLETIKMARISCDNRRDPTPWTPPWQCIHCCKMQGRAPFGGTFLEIVLSTTDKLRLTRKLCGYTHTHVRIRLAVHVFLTPAIGFFSLLHSHPPGMEACEVWIVPYKLRNYLVGGGSCNAKDHRSAAPPLTGVLCWGLYPTVRET